MGQIINTGSYDPVTGGAFGAIGFVQNLGQVSTGLISDLNNLSTGLISGGSGGDAIDAQNFGSITNLNNAGSINASYGVAVAAALGGSISNIVNSGTISNTGTAGGFLWWSGNDGGSAIYNSGYIRSLTNTGSIYTTAPAAFGIYNNVDTISYDSSVGRIDTLTNAQGAGNARGPLTYTGALPTNYNIIINSPTSFGRLAVTGGTGSTTFGISALSAVGTGMLGNYSSVITGVSNTQLGISGLTKSGTSNGYGYTLTETALGSTIWSLYVISSPLDPTPTGPSTVDTQQSLLNTSAALQNTFTLQNTVLANSFSYDCNLFGANNVCVSAGGRNTTVQATNGLNNTSALLIAAYRPHPNYRVGAYADQNLSVSNPAGTVNLGNNTPLLGLFGVWNERLDGTGTEVKVSAAYGQKNTTVTRGVVGSGATASESGSGTSQLNSQGDQVMAKYGFGLADSIIVSPYVGVRYTQNNMGGYTEGASSTVTAPLTYSALNTNATTALAGLGASYKVVPAVTTFASAGVETDTNTNTSNGSYSATGVSGLTPVNFNPNPVRTRPTAMVGAYYDIVKNQRLGVTGIYRQEAYQAVATTTVMATYTIGL